MTENLRVDIREKQVQELLKLIGKIGKEAQEKGLTEEKVAELLD